MLDETTLGRLRELRDAANTPAARAVGAALARLQELEIRDGDLTLSDALAILGDLAKGTDRLGRAAALVLADHAARRTAQPDRIARPRRARP